MCKIVDDLWIKIIENVDSITLCSLCCCSIKLFQITKHSNFLNVLTKALEKDIRVPLNAYSEEQLRSIWKMIINKSFRNNTIMNDLCQFYLDKNGQIKSLQNVKPYQARIDRVINKLSFTQMLTFSEQEEEIKLLLLSNQGKVYVLSFLQLDANIHIIEDLQHLTVIQMSVSYHQNTNIVGVLTKDKKVYRCVITNKNVLCKSNFTHLIRLDNKNIKQICCTAQALICLSADNSNREYIYNDEDIHTNQIHLVKAFSHDGMYLCYNHETILLEFTSVRGVTKIDSVGYHLFVTTDFGKTYFLAIYTEQFYQDLTTVDKTLINHDHPIIQIASARSDNGPHILLDNTGKVHLLSIDTKIQGWLLLNNINNNKINYKPHKIKSVTYRQDFIPINTNNVVQVYKEKIQHINQLTSDVLIIPYHVKIGPVDLVNKIY